MGFKRADYLGLWLRNRRFIKAQHSDAWGFTLIELLVTMIIIGILAAISLPSFLNQANKARYSEAKTYIGTMSRLQQAYYLEKKTFTDVIGNLNVGVNTTTSNFTYSVISGDVNGNSSPIQLDQIVTNVATPTSPNVNAFVAVVGIPGVVRIDTVFCVANSPNIFINPGSMNSISQTMICPSNFSNE